MGVKTPAGNDLDTFWDTHRPPPSRRPRRGRSSTPTSLPVKFGCEVKDFDPTTYLDVKEARRQDRVAQLGFAAAADAIAAGGRARRRPGALRRRRAAPASAASSPSSPRSPLYAEKGAERVSPFLVPMMMTNATAGLISIQFGWTGPSLMHHHGVRRRRQRHRRGRPAHPRGLGRRRARRRRRDVDHADRHLRLRPHGRAVGAQRRPEAGVAPVRRGPRRVRHGRGRRRSSCSRSRTARSRAAPRSSASCSATAATATPTTSPRRRRVAPARWRACSLALDDAGLAGGGRQPRQRPRHVDAAQRRRRVRGRSPRCSAGSTPPVTSIKGVTGHLVGAAGAVEAVAALLVAAQRPRAAGRQLRDPRPRHRRRRRPRRAAGDRRRRGPVELVRVRRPQRLARPRPG